MFNFKLNYYLLFASILLLPSITLASPNISVEINPTTGTIEDIFELQVVVSGDSAANSTNPTFESSKEFTLRQHGTSTQQSYINGQLSFQVVYSYSVYPDPQLTPGKYQLPQGKIEINGRAQSLESTEITIEEKGSSSGNLSNNTKTGVDFVQLVDDLEPYVGQQISYRAEILINTSIANVSISDPEFTSFWSESFGKAQETVRSVRNQNTKVISLRQALYPTQAKTIVLPQRVLTADIQTFSNLPQPNWSGSLFDEFWPDITSINRGQLVQKRFVADPIKLNVKPLPPAPTNTSQKYFPVGNVELSSSIDKNNLKQGDSITLKIELTGDANFRPLDLPEAEGPNKNDFKIYPEKPSVSTSISGNRLIQKKSYTLALVPLKSGTLKIPSFNFLIFDPKIKDYKLLKSTEEQLSVTPDSNINTLSSNVQIHKSAQDDSVLTPQPKIFVEDLMAQHIGATALVRTANFNPTIFWLIIWLTPTSMLVVKFYFSQKLKLSPELTLQRKALPKALKSIDRLSTKQDNFSETLTQIITSFLREKFLDQRESLTAKEARELVETQSKNSILANNITNILQTLEEMRFSANSSSQFANNQSEIIQQTKNLFIELGKNGK